MRHTLVSAKPGEPGGFRTGHVGEYRCSCGAVLPGIGSYKKHRTTSLHDEAVERVARALMRLEYESYGNGNVSWDDIAEDGPEFSHMKYRTWATVLVRAAKVRQ
jgi:hypothetical protein